MYAHMYLFCLDCMNEFVEGWNAWNWSDMLLMIHLHQYFHRCAVSEHCLCGLSNWTWTLW